jgi:3-hydroxybutyryl-CoA dehydrogenase
MGQGIIRVLSGAGHAVRFFDPAAAGQVAAGDRVVACASVADAVEGADVIFEAIIEVLEAKHALYRQIEETNTTAPIASNTSTFVPSRLAEGLRDESRLLIAHFFNPADVVPLVELVPGARTDVTAVESVRALLVSAGKTVVVLDHESTGFVANRLQAALVREAMNIVSENIASPEIVDLVMTDCLAPRWMAAGPFMTMDRGGLDVWQKVCQQIFPTLDDRDQPLLLEEHVGRGDLGVKTGRGFYLHDAADRERGDRAVAQAFAARATTQNDGP